MKFIISYLEKNYPELPKDQKTLRKILKEGEHFNWN